jgi:hypothetical protein
MNAHGLIMVLFRHVPGQTENHEKLQQPATRPEFQRDPPPPNKSVTRKVSRSVAGTIIALSVNPCPSQLTNWLNCVLNISPPRGHKSRAPRRRRYHILNSGTDSFWILTFEFPSCQHPGPQNFEVPPGFLEHLCTPDSINNTGQQNLTFFCPTRKNI